MQQYFKAAKEFIDRKGMWRRKKRKTNRLYCRRALEHFWNSNVTSKLFTVAYFPVFRSFIRVTMVTVPTQSMMNPFRIDTPVVASHSNTLFYWHNAGAASKVSSTPQSILRETCKGVNILRSGCMCIKHALWLLAPSKISWKKSCMKINSIDSIYLEPAKIYWEMSQTRPIEAKSIYDDYNEFFSLFPSLDN